MATLVCFHAHPDDEAVATAGTMAGAAAAGHRVVLVVATRGEQGEVVEGFLEPGERLGDRRVTETHAAAEILGVSRVEFLGYTDSGMMGMATNADPACFWQADVDAAAARLAAILVEEGAEVLTAYDDHGTYGHPDHIQVHRVGVRAAALAATPHLYEATVNRDHARRLAVGAPPGTAPDVDEMRLGVPETALTTAIDVSAWLEAKRASMRAHASQISEQSFFLALPPELFLAFFGTEWFIHRGVPVPVPIDGLETSLLLRT
ncbi:MAG: PIG-L family deacetylase [Acidimicrobiales bacterium]